MLTTIVNGKVIILLKQIWFCYVKIANMCTPTRIVVYPSSKIIIGFILFLALVMINILGTIRAMDELIIFIIFIIFK